MATFLLLHGAASSGWYWHLVEPLLAAAGHNTVAPDLPADDPTAALSDYAATAVDALTGHHEGQVVVVAQSSSPHSGRFTLVEPPFHPRNPPPPTSGTNGRTDRWTDGWTNGQLKRVRDSGSFLWRFGFRAFAHFSSTGCDVTAEVITFPTSSLINSGIFARSRIHVFLSLANSIDNQIFHSIFQQHIETVRQCCDRETG